MSSSTNPSKDDENNDTNNVGVVITTCDIDFFLSVVRRFFFGEFLFVEINHIKFSLIRY